MEPAKGFWSYGMNMPKWKCGDGREWKRLGCNEGSERDYLLELIWVPYYLPYLSAQQFDF